MHKWKITEKAREVFSKDISSDANVTATKLILLRRPMKHSINYSSIDLNNIPVSFPLSSTNEQTMRFVIDNKNFTQRNFDGGDSYNELALVARVESNTSDSYEFIYAVLTLDEAIDIPEISSGKFVKNIEVTSVFDNIVNMINISGSESITTDLENIKSRLSVIEKKSSTSNDVFDDIISRMVRRGG